MAFIHQRSLATRTGTRNQTEKKMVVFRGPRECSLFPQRLSDPVALFPGVGQGPSADAQSFSKVSNQSVTSTGWGQRDGGRDWNYRCERIPRSRLVGDLGVWGETPRWAHRLVLLDEVGACPCQRKRAILMSR